MSEEKRDHKNISDATGTTLCRVIAYNIDLDSAFRNIQH